MSQLDRLTWEAGLPFLAFSSWLFPPVLLFLYAMLLGLCESTAFAPKIWENDGTLEMTVGTCKEVNVSGETEVTKQFPPLSPA